MVMCITTWQYLLGFYLVSFFVLEEKKLCNFLGVAKLSMNMSCLVIYEFRNFFNHVCRYNKNFHVGLLLTNFTFHEKQWMAL
jgi:hypothetical protein